MYIYTFKTERIFRSWLLGDGHTKADFFSALDKQIEEL